LPPRRSRGTCSGTILEQLAINRKRCPHRT
jgi:hypothetical protein